MEPQELAERIFPGRVRHVEPLGGGITNHNFRVDLGDETVVLRVAGKDTDLLGIDRFVERDASVVAAELGVGPEVVGFVEPEGYLITRFIEGRPVPLEEMRRPQVVGRVAETLRRVHEGPPIPGRFDSFRVVETYAETAAAHGVRLPESFRWAKGVADEIETARRGALPVPCHNDLLNANFLDDGAAVRIVDWEYAGMGDRFFDLANFSINHEFDDEANGVLLESYFGSVEAEDARALRLMRFMSDFREAMWGVVQQGISELDVDFVAYADEHFERLRRTSADPAFDAALRG
ncbi:MAG: phosphotransferase [Gaiellaceae bacterium]